MTKRYNGVNNPEFLFCPDCGVYIHVLSKRRDGTYNYCPVIPFCPQCCSKAIYRITSSVFNNVDGFNVVWIRVVKKYGTKFIKFSLKFKGVSNSELE